MPDFRTMKLICLSWSAEYLCSLISRNIFREQISLFSETFFLFPSCFNFSQLAAVWVRYPQWCLSQLNHFWGEICLWSHCLIESGSFPETLHELLNKFVYEASPWINLLKACQLFFISFIVITETHCATILSHSFL